MLFSLKKAVRVAALAVLAVAITAGTALAGELVVLSTSDVHGSVVGWNYFTAQSADVGLAKVSTVIKEEKSKLSAGDAMLIVDAGDIVQGTPLDTYMLQNQAAWRAGEHPMFAAFRAIGYDAITCGNHEFNFGLGYLKRAAGENTKLLGANIIDDKTGKTWAGVRPYVLREVKVDGERVRVGIIGTVTPTIPLFELPANYAGLHFAGQVPVIKDCIRDLQAQGADIIIATVHSGVERADWDPSNEVIAIARACPELALIVCAHNHVVIDSTRDITAPGGTRYPGAVINGVPLVESGKDGKFIGKSVLTLNKVNGKWQVTKARTAALSVQGVADDPEIARQVKPWHDRTLAYLAQQVGTASGDFLGAESSRRDSAIVDLVNTVQREAAGTNLSAAAAFNTAQDIVAGSITLQQLSGLYLYENYLYGIEITGAQLYKYLEHAARFYGTMPDYNYDMLAGCDYTIDMSRPVGSRITRLEYRGRAVQPEDRLTLALNDYRYNGGGGYMRAMGFDAEHPPKTVYDSRRALGDDGQVRTLLINYIQKRGTIAPTVDNNWQVVGLAK